MTGVGMMEWWVEMTSGEWLDSRLRGNDGSGGLPQVDGLHGRGLSRQH